MKRIAGFLFLLLMTVNLQARCVGEFSADVVDDVLVCFKNADTKELAKYFASTVNMSIRNEEGIYSNVQTEIILKEFFNRNSPKEIRIIHRLDSNPNFRYVVFNLSTEKQQYRVSYKLVAEHDSFKLTELRIE